MLSGEDTSVIPAEDVPAGTGLPQALHLVDVPPGEDPAPPPQLLGYKGPYNGADYGDSQYLGTFGPQGAYGGGELVMMAGGAQVGVESLAQAAVILVIGVAIIISNIIVLATFITMPGESR